MKKLFLFVAACMMSIGMSAAVSITVEPNNVDLGVVSLKGHETTGVEGSVTIDVTYSGLQPYCGVYFENVEMPDENAAFWLSGTNTAGYIYGGDQYTSAEGKGLTLNYYATDPGSYTGKIRFYSYEDDYWTVESPSVYLTVKLVVIADELPRTEMVRINSTAELQDGDEVVFVCETANAVCGSLEGTYLPAITEDVTINNGIAQVPLKAQLFRVSKYSGNWQFTTTDTGKRLNLDITGKGAFTYDEPVANQILAGWGISISGGTAEVGKPDGTFPVRFNADRFKPYKSENTGTDIAIYKKAQSSPGTAIGEVQRDEVPCTKVLRNGQLYILHNGMMYDVQGKRVQE